jgi:NADH:ubiquinone oxidoreductase subunit E
MREYTESGDVSVQTCKTQLCKLRGVSSVTQALTVLHRFMPATTVFLRKHGKYVLQY